MDQIIEWLSEPAFLTAFLGKVAGPVVVGVFAIAGAIVLALLRRPIEALWEWFYRAYWRRKGLTVERREDQ